MSSRASRSSRLFFSGTDSAFDGSGMDLDSKFFPELSGEFARAERLVRDDQPFEDRHHVAAQLVWTARATLLRDEPRDPRLLEVRLCLVECWPREAELRCGLRHCDVVHPYAAKHLVLYLDEIPGIEELPLVEPGRDDSLGVGVQRALVAKGPDLVVVWQVRSMLYD